MDDREHLIKLISDADPDEIKALYLFLCENESHLSDSFFLNKPFDYDL